MVPPKPASAAAAAHVPPPSASAPSTLAAATAAAAAPSTAAPAAKPLPLSTTTVALSPASKLRGKFLNKNSPTPSSLQNGANADDHTENNNNNERDNLRTHVHNSKIAATSRRKAIARRRDAVFDDLKNAENIVLSLLECASDVAEALSEMTTAKSKGEKKEKVAEEVGDGNGDNNKSGNKNNAEESFEDLTARVRSSGVGYLVGVKKLHGLLAPHASLVKSYKNHDKEQQSSSSSSSYKTDAEKSHKPLTAALPGATAAVAATDGISRKVVEEATSNMYAARVKKRLATERFEILSEMIRLEEAEGCGGNGGGGSSGSGNNGGRNLMEEMNDVDAAGSKRKHESIEQT